MIAYRNTRTGRIVEIPEDPPDGADVRGRVDQWRRQFTRMDASKRWERLDEAGARAANQAQAGQQTEPGGQESGPDSEPEPAAVRAWAKQEGIDIPARGKLPAETVEAYKAAHAGE